MSMRAKVTYEDAFVTPGLTEAEEIAGDYASWDFLLELESNDTQDSYYGSIDITGRSVEEVVQMIRAAADQIATIKETTDIPQKTTVA